MKISDFDYDLPPELIAQAPLDSRDASRMLIVDRATQTWSDSTFRNFSDFLKTDDVVVLNNSRVFPARLTGFREGSGGRVEIFLVRELEAMVWEALVRPGGRLKRGSRADIGNGRLQVELVDAPGEEPRPVHFLSTSPLQELLAEVGSIPLPPYIKRMNGATEADRERYQTIYSKQRGAIAAPTAGLHFTHRVLEQIKTRAQLVEITLHVGYGTFEPVRVEDVSQHQVSGERFEISEPVARTINAAKRVIVVGTTTMRALESSASPEGRVVAQTGVANLTIRPGHNFRVANALLTNF